LDKLSAELPLLLRKLSGIRLTSGWEEAGCLEAIEGEGKVSDTSSIMKNSSTSSA
jgi:hypothetical protein